MNELSIGDYSIYENNSKVISNRIKYYCLNLYFLKHWNWKKIYIYKINKLYNRRIFKFDFLENFQIKKILYFLLFIFRLIYY